VRTLVLLAGVPVLFAACGPIAVMPPVAARRAAEPDPIRAENMGLLAEQQLPGSEQTLPTFGPQSLMPSPLPGPLPGKPPLAPPGRPGTLRLPGLAEAPPKATDIPEFPTLDDLEVEARLERLSKLPPSRGLDIVRTGLTQKGRRYRWGGAIPTTGFDCSGFTQWTFQQHGINLPRTAVEQFHTGERVGRQELHPGDLVFYKINRRGRWHVGIYMDDGVFVHSPRRGRSISESNMDDAYWVKRYMGARRYTR
jgi:cell wall-associated NlpC family hydrolase